MVQRGTFANKASYFQINVYILRGIPPKKNLKTKTKTKPQKRVRKNNQQLLKKESFHSLLLKNKTTFACIRESCPLFSNYRIYQRTFLVYLLMFFKYIAKVMRLFVQDWLCTAKYMNIYLIQFFPTKMSLMGFRTLRNKLYKFILLHDKIFQDERQNTQERTNK